MIAKLHVYYFILFFSLLVLVALTIGAALIYSISTVYVFIANFAISIFSVGFTLILHVILLAILQIKKQRQDLQFNSRHYLMMGSISLFMLGLISWFFLSFVLSYELIAILDDLGFMAFYSLMTFMIGGLVIIALSGIGTLILYFKVESSIDMISLFRKFQSFSILTLIIASGIVAGFTTLLLPDGNWLPMEFSEPAYDLPSSPHYNPNLDALLEDDKEILEALEKGLWAITKLRQQGGFPMWAETDGSHFYSDRSKSLPLFPGEFSLQEGTALLAGLYVQMYELEPNPIYLNVAVEAADALIAVQDEQNGGFYYDGRRHEDGTGYQPHPKNHMRKAVLDDNVMQSSLSFLLDVYDVTKEEKYREAFENGFDCLISMEGSDGGWIQRSGFQGKVDGMYFNYVTLNDGTLKDVVMVLLKANALFPLDQRYLTAAKRAGRYLLEVQGNGGSLLQKGWAQQYDERNQPAWARNFEPPAMCSAATISALETLLQLYLTTGNMTWLEPFPSALAWLESEDTKIEWEEDGEIQQGHARLYELQTNTPIYGWDFGKGLLPVYYYEPVRPGYGWRGEFGVANMFDRHETLISLNYDAHLFEQQMLSSYMSNLKSNALAAISQQTDDGYWLSDGQIRAGPCASSCQYMIDYLNYNT